MSNYNQKQLIERSWLTNSRLQKRLDLIDELQSEEQQLEFVLVSKYLNFLVRRRLMQYLVMGSNDVESYRSMIESIVRLVFKMLISQTELERDQVKKIRCMISTRSSYPKTQFLGRLNRGKLGRTMILGQESVHALTVIHIIVECSSELTMRVYDHLRAMRKLLSSLEEVVPLCQTIALSFRISPQDSRFVLSKLDAEASKTILGINSVFAKKTR